MCPKRTVADYRSMYASILRIARIQGAVVIIVTVNWSEDTSGGGVATICSACITVIARRV